MHSCVNFSCTSHETIMIGQTTKQMKHKAHKAKLAGYVNLGVTSEANSAFTDTALEIAKEAYFHSIISKESISWRFITILGWII